MKKVLIITYYWPPSGGSGVQRWMYFSKYLPEYNYEPYVITVNKEKASYKFTDTSFESKVSDVKVFRTDTFEPFGLYARLIGKNRKDAIPQAFAGESNPGLVQKLSRFIRGNLFIPDARVGWNSHAFKEACKLIADEKIDFVVTTGPPHSTHLVGLKLKKKFSIPWIADFRDPWIEVFYNRLFYRSRFAQMKDSRLEMSVLTNADLVLTVGPSMSELLRSKLNQDAIGSKVHFVYNGYDAEVFESLQAKKRNDKFVICHLGILSDNQPVDSFVKALKKLIDAEWIDPGKIRLLLIGKIAPNIIDLIKNSLPSIEFIVKSYLPHKEALQEIVNSDLLFNSLAEVESGKYLISGKLMEYAATGNPILCLGDPEGDGQKILDEYENAKVFSRSDSEGILNFILNMYKTWLSGNIGKGIDSKAGYSRRNMTKRLAEILNQKFNNI